jgi:hypothetical protein
MPAADVQDCFLQSVTSSMSPHQLLLAGFFIAKIKNRVTFGGGAKVPSGVLRQVKTSR